MQDKRGVQRIAVRLDFKMLTRVRYVSSVYIIFILGIEPRTSRMEASTLQLLIYILTTIFKTASRRNTYNVLHPPPKKSTLPNIPKGKLKKKKKTIVSVLYVG